MIRSDVTCAFTVFSLCALIAACGKTAAPPPPAIPVTLTPVRRADVPLLIRATGTVEPIRTAAVQSQVNAQVLHVRFTEVDDVRERQVLFELDARPFEAALGQAQAVLSRDRAQWENAQHDVQRYSALASKEYITQQQLDQAKATAGALKVRNKPVMVKARAKQNQADSVKTTSLASIFIQ